MVSLPLVIRVLHLRRTFSRRSSIYYGEVGLFKERLTVLKGIDQKFFSLSEAILKRSALQAERSFFETANDHWPLTKGSNKCLE